MALFSERHGFSPQKTLQVTELDSRTRTRILNCFELAYLNSISRNVTSLKISDDKIIMFLMRLTDEYFGDRMPYSFGLVDWILLKRKIESRIQEGKWYQVYDLIEFFIQKYPYQKNTVALTQCLNKVFHEENVGYRIIANQVVPIFDKGEVKEIEDALVATEHLPGPHKHLEDALKLLSASRRASDKSAFYKNSIKESICAVEALVRILIKNKKATLGAGMKKVQELLGLHPEIARSISALYFYTSSFDSGGIRHGDETGENLPSFEDAKFMIVTCSAILNYLLSKAQKKGVELRIDTQ